MNAIAEFVIALADLFEAEARAMRLSLVRMVGAIALVLGAVLLSVLGLGLWLWALYIFALGYLSQETAALATGAATFLGAGVLAWIAARLNR